MHVLVLQPSPGRGGEQGLLGALRDRAAGVFARRGINVVKRQNSSGFASCPASPLFRETENRLSLFSEQREGSQCRGFPSPSCAAQLCVVLRPQASGENQRQVSVPGNQHVSSHQTRCV